MGGERRDVAGELGQRGSVTFSQLADTPGERLRNTVQFALDVGADGGQPFSFTTRALISSSVNSPYCVATFTMSDSCAALTFALVVASVSMRAK